MFAWGCRACELALWVAFPLHPPPPIQWPVPFLAPGSIPCIRGLGGEILLLCISQTPEKASGPFLGGVLPSGQSRALGFAHPRVHPGSSGPLCPGRFVACSTFLVSLCASVRFCRAMLVAHEAAPEDLEAALETLMLEVEGALRDEVLFVKIQLACDACRAQCLQKEGAVVGCSCAMASCSSGGS